MTPTISAPMIYATTIDQALSIWSCLQGEIDWSALTQVEEAPPSIAAGFLDIALVGAVPKREQKPYELIDGVPVVRHAGSTSMYPTLARLWGYAPRTLTYSEISEGLRGGAADPRAQTPPLLVLDTFGGGVDGHAEAVRAVRETGAEIFVERGTSAGTWLAAAASRVTAAEAALMGSIGVISVPVDVSARIKALGLRPVPIVSNGAEAKAIGADGSVDEAYVAKVSALLNVTALRFQKAVLEGRGLKEDQAKRAFTGGVWVGEDNVDLGLADDVAADMYQVIQAMNDRAASRRRSTATTTTGGHRTMEEEKETQETAEGDFEARLKAAEEQLTQQEVAHEAALAKERTAREAALAKLQAAETERTVDQLMAQCAGAPPCLTEGRDLRAFLNAAIQGNWKIAEEGGSEATAADFVVGLISDARGLIAVTGKDAGGIAEGDAPHGSKRQVGHQDSQDDEDRNAEEADLNEALDGIFDARFDGGSSK